MSIQNVVHGLEQYNNQKEDTTQRSIKWWMNKQEVVNPYNGILLGTEREWTGTWCNTDKPWKHAKKAVTKDQILHESNYMKCLEWANL